MKVDSL